ncbi:MAG TPA: serine/threonine-protein kinase [Polyangiaceae bacterium]|jgi:serine/threonine-protein kinase
MAPATDDADLPESESERDRMADARIGQVVAASYRIVRYIASGGSSHVFQAEHLRLGKSFAIKLLRVELDSSRRAAQRFRREAKAIARLNSEHIVSVIDCGELDDGTPYLVMELLEGEDLRTLLSREGTLPARRAVQLIIEACRGLTAVHDAGLVHRDLKPENLFVTKRATGEDWCKVLDFGVAKMEASLSTAEGAIVGTVRYMAPEQLSDSPAVGPATDVYALGAILYECLSGKAAHEGETIQQVMFSVMNREPTALSVLCPGLPRELVGAVERCLAKERRKRPQQPSELAGTLLTTIGRSIGAVSNQTLSEDDPVVVVPRRQRPNWVNLALLPLAILASASIAWLAKPNGYDSTPKVEKTSAKPSTGALEPIQPTATAMAAPSARAIAPESAAPVLAPAPRPAPRAYRAAPPREVPATKAPASRIGRLDPANPYGE